jgi:hypothetical protein
MRKLLIVLHLLQHQTFKVLNGIQERRAEQPSPKIKFMKTAPGLQKRWDGRKKVLYTERPERAGRVAQKCASGA